MAFDKIGPNGKIMDQFGIDTGQRIDDRGNITDRFGMVTRKSINSSGQIIDGFNGLGLMAFKSVDPNTGNVVDNLNSNMPTTIEDTLLPMKSCFPLNAPNPVFNLPSGLSLPSSPNDMSDENWETFVQQMKVDLNLTVCHHTEEKSGIFTEKWGCGRKVKSDDLCEQAGSDVESCIAYISQAFDISDDTASHVLDRLQSFHLLQAYKCNAVFFT